MSDRERKRSKQRIDTLLVERGLVESREKAKALLLAGAVRVDGQRVDKAGQNVSIDSSIELAEMPRYVGRGGLKLEGALERFGVDATGRVCLDVGASTGGFTDCLLQHGAARVYAFDVGAGQLDWRLRNDPRVVVREGVNARYLRPEDLPEPVDLIVCDVSFISVTMILPALPPLLRTNGEIIILVKPQFEVGREQVGKGGIVRDPQLQAEACARVEAVVQALGFKTAIMESPILGAAGNREFLLYAAH
jgi:23S rRNA (cytidine1920-2'-O)/16S rRNA (cytidine1409-2'-O)-methyltransferase